MQICWNSRIDFVELKIHQLCQDAEDLTLKHMLILCFSTNNQWREESRTFLLCSQSY